MELKLPSGKTMRPLYLLALLSACFSAMAQPVYKPQRPQLHVIFVLEQRELEFARLNMENDTLMTSFVETVHQVLNYPLQIRHLSEKNFIRKALQDTIAALKTAPNDIIILYYAGYGIPPANPAENFANWRLDNDNKTGLPVSEVENWLRAKKVHLGLLIADCSTQRIEHNPTRAMASTELSVDLTREIIHQLFLRNKGIVKLGSSTPSAPGYVNLMMNPVNDKYFPGTVFTNAFCEAFSAMLRVGPRHLSQVSLPTLTAWTARNMGHILFESPYKQTPVLEIKNWDGSTVVRKQDATVTTPAENQWQGLIIDEYAYDRLSQKWLNLPAKRLPTRVDMSAYAPPVINQGDKGTCVAVSIGYYMRSILEARKRGITNKSEISKLSFSPFYLYNQLKMYSDRACTFGIEAGATFEYIKQNGLPRLSAFSNPNACEINQPVRADPSSRIEDYVKLFHITAPKEDKVLAAKQALAEFSPIVVGIQTTGSMAHLSFTRTLVPRLKAFVSELISDNGDEPDPTMVWQPNQSNSLDFGHAMCVVGYDDTMLGKGAFKLINSWGSYWGDKGYFWMSYDTFGRYAKYGYQAYLPTTVRASANLLDTDLTISSGAFMNKPLPFTAPSNGTTLGTYALTRPQRTGTPFKFRVSVKKQTYLYLITASEADSTRKLLPLPGYKMIVTPGNRLRYPSDNTTLNLSGKTGREYWLFLFSATAITEIDSYVQRINALEGPFPDRVTAAFGNTLTPGRLIRYKPKKMGFFLENDQRVRDRIVPLLVTLNHIP